MSSIKKFTYDLGFKVDQRGIEEAKRALLSVQSAVQQSGTDQFKQTEETAKQLNNILSKAWNGKLQQFNLNTVNKEIQQT